MKRMRILGLALVAVFALAAVVAASASAEATWTECAKTEKNLEGKYTAKYTDKACTIAASEEQIATGKENKYELKEGIGKGKPFKTKGGAATLHVIIPATGKGAFPGGAHVEVKCTSFKGGGQPALPNKVEKVTSAFKGCTVLAAPCQSGEKKGVIETNALSGEMVDAEETASGVAVLLKAEAGPASPLASFTCTEVASTNVLGSVMAEHTGNVGKVAKESADIFAVGPGLGEVEYAPGAKYTPLVNIPTHKTGEPAGSHFLLSEITEAGQETPAGTLPSGQEGTANNKGEKNVMVKP